MDNCLYQGFTYAAPTTVERIVAMMATLKRRMTQSRFFGLCSVVRLMVRVAVCTEDETLEDILDLLTAEIHGLDARDERDAQTDMRHGL